MVNIVPALGLREILKRCFIAGGAPALQVQVFVNDVTPDINTVFGDLTPSTMGGFSPVAIAAPILDSGLTPVPTPRWSITWSDNTWTWDLVGVPQTCYGYLIHNPADNVLWWAVRFDAPKTPSVATPSIRVTPSLQDAELIP